MERANAVTFLGNPLTLVGNPVSPGDPAPDATVLKQDLTPVRIHDYKGQTC
jgi:thiol peroxidase